MNFDWKATAAVLSGGILALGGYHILKELSEHGKSSSTPSLTEPDGGWSHQLVFYINGKKIVENNVDPRTKLLHYLREHLKITSPKEGCGQGVCGACTVMVSSYDIHTQKVIHRAVNSCLMPLCEVHNKAVVTVEGLGVIRGELHPIQERFAATHASQCGFCTPGMIMAFYTLLRNNPNPTPLEIINHMDGNLCRCTGYRPILDAMKSFSDSESGCCGSGACGSCPNSGKVSSQGIASGCCTGLSSLGQLKPLQLDSELIFPPSLRELPTPLHIEKDGHHWYSPTSLASLLTVLKEQRANILSGNGTGLLSRGGSFVSTKNVPDLTLISWSPTGVAFGAAVTLETLLNALNTRKDQCLAYAALAAQLGRIASTQVRNTSTVGGNIISNEWHSDLITALFSVDAQAIVVDLEGHTRKVPINLLNLAEKEFLLSVYVPKNLTNTFIRTYKISKKSQCSRAVISAGLSVTLQNNRVVNVCLAFGGVGKHVSRSSSAEQYLYGQFWTPEILPHILEALHSDFDAGISEVKDSEYRKSMLESIFFMFFHSASAYFEKLPDPFLETEDQVGHGVQSFSLRGEEIGPTGKPIMHLSGDLHTSGDAVFLEDMQVPDCLHSYFILSSRVHAKILSINDVVARTMPGVQQIFYASDLACNRVGEIDGNTVFANKEVEYYAQPIGLVVAETLAQAKEAAKAVVVLYEDLPVINTIDDAIKANSFFPNGQGPMAAPDMFAVGNVEQGFAEADVTLQGEFSISGVEHWYLEPHVHLVIPGERQDEFTVWSTTQSTDAVSSGVAKALGINQCKVRVCVKRLGGGFGGKGEVHHTAAAAIASYRLNRPVKLFVERELDLLITGKRCDTKVHYKIGLKRSGKVSAVDLHVWQNSGYQMGLSSFVLMETMISLDGPYVFPNFRVQGKLCRTNRVGSRPVRTAGKGQSCAILENIMEHAATELKIPPHRFRELNFAKVGSVTLFHQTFKEKQVLIEEIWAQAVREIQYDRRLEEVKTFNLENRLKKRGIAIIPSRYVYYPKQLQAFGKAIATVALMLDGSVVLQHGAIEMGQGVHTKIQQLCASTLGVPMEKVFTTEVTSYNSPNAAVSGGSTGTDFWGSAVIDACNILNSRLEPFKKKMPDQPLAKICEIAHFSGINLCAQGWHIFEPWWTDPNSHDFLYFSWNCAVVEVELDLLTGKHVILSSSCWQDVGQSLNPMIDIGQIEGGLMQGFSWVTLEDLEATYNSRGVLELGVESYEIPSIKNIPVSFNVSLVPNTTNPHVTNSSKGIGEPPYLLGFGLVLALREAIAAARIEHGKDPWVHFDFPATTARIKNALRDINLMDIPSKGASKKLEE